MVSMLPFVRLHGSLPQDALPVGLSLSPPLSDLLYTHIQGYSFSHFHHCTSVWIEESSLASLSFARSFQFSQDRFIYVQERDRINMLFLENNSLINQFSSRRLFKQFSLVLPRIFRGEKYDLVLIRKKSQPCLVIYTLKRVLGVDKDPLSLEILENRHWLLGRQIPGVESKGNNFNLANLMFLFFCAVINSLL